MKGDNRKLILNTVLPVALQLSTIISAFVLPRLIMQYYGSEVNGLVTSITQFLSIISFMEMGVGSVVRFNFYKPLTEQNTRELSKIYCSSNRFFRRIAAILFAYVIGLIIFYPLGSRQSFSHIYTATLILAMSISFFSQYYFGQTNSILLTADQRGYIQYSAQIVTIIANTICTIILVLSGCSIQLVKLCSSVIYLLRPLYLEMYVSRKYKIDKHIHISGEPIKQKWNGLAQHVAAVILESTDVIVLTVFSNYKYVSIYSTYHLVANGVRTVLVSASNGFEAKLGNIIAKGNEQKTKELFEDIEWIFHTATVFVFGCTLVLIIPFVAVYTQGITDANYYQPLFAVLITLAYSTQGFRLPYIMLIFTYGHYKQTQNSFWITALLNIGISIILVNYYGLIGVALGTLISMLYQTVWMALYCSKHIIIRPFNAFVKRVLTDIISILLIAIVGIFIRWNVISYWTWALYAITIAIIAFFILIITNLLLYNDKSKRVFALTKNIIKRRRIEI